MASILRSVGYRKVEGKYARVTGTPNIRRFFCRAHLFCGAIRSGIRAIMLRLSHLSLLRSESARPPLSPLAEAIPPSTDDVTAALSSCRGAFLSIGLFSGVSNILMLTGSFFMLQVYDRVLPSRSVPTLVALFLLAAGLFTAQGLLDMIRGRIL